MDSRFPRLSDAEIRDVAKALYGMEVDEVVEVGGEVDQNVRLGSAAGEAYLLKASPVAAMNRVRWEQDVSDRLRVSTPSLPVPHPVLTIKGEKSPVVPTGDGDLVVRLTTWLPGERLCDVAQPSQELLRELGQIAARIVRALDGLDPSDRTHAWDMRVADQAVDEALVHVGVADDAELVRHLMDRYRDVQDRLPKLPQGVVHHDLNDANVLVARDKDGRLRISGVVDFGDALPTARVTEVAVAAAYAMLRADDPLWAASAVVGGFQEVVPLTEEEVSVIFPLAAARLCLNATVWTRRIAEEGTVYGQRRMRDTWPTLRKLGAIPRRLAEAALRAACGMPLSGAPAEETLRSATSRAALHPVMDGEFTRVDLSPASDLFDDLDWTDTAQLLDALDGVLCGAGRVGVVQHLTARLPHSAQRSIMPTEPATVQLGTTLVAKAGTPVKLPLRGTIRLVRPDAVVVEHDLGPGVGKRIGPGRADVEHTKVWTRWSGITARAICGATLAAGDSLGTVRQAEPKTRLGPGVHLQVVTDEELALSALPVLIRRSERPWWAALSLDPELLLAVGHEPGPGPAHRNVHEVVALRDQRLARSQRAYYQRPPNFVRGRGVWLYDEDGLAYLDAINNVTHVGHAEPRITAVAASQLKKLNTNSRFVYEGIVTYAQRLVETLPDPLEVVFLVCTGSEANDLALRMARQVTGRQHVLVIDGAYHGNTAAVMGISPNRYKGPGGRGAPPTTHEVPCPDLYRRPHGSTEQQATAAYTDEVRSIVAGLVDSGRPPAAFIAESLMGTAGSIVLPDGFLSAGFDAVREAGGLCISDEVQVGVGRMGTHFWGFEMNGVVPDIVTMGKPLGNGHPVAAVVTTREVADAFDDGVKYFNTFGGNPVSCAIGTAVLDIVRDDGLQEHARVVGEYFLGRLRDLQDTHPLIGDVRGHGLYLGVELVRDRGTKDPAPREALLLSERMKDRGVIVYPAGAHQNVLKLKPPMIFDTSHVDNFVETMHEILCGDEMQRG